MVSPKASGHHHRCADAASAACQTTKNATEMTTLIESPIAVPACWVNYLKCYSEGQRAH